MKQKTKRGFERKPDAAEWERKFKLQMQFDMTMNFERFVEVYTNDRKPRLKLNTWLTKEYIVKEKLIPYFGRRKMNEIKASDIIKWQNTLMNSLMK